MRTKKLVQTASYDKWSTGGEWDCTHCGKPISSEPRLWVHIIDGGGIVLHRDDEALYISGDDDLGMYAVGPECAKAIGINFITEK